MLIVQSRRALLSWSNDVIASIVVLILLITWISDLQKASIPSSSESNRLSASFLRDGFCLSPRFDNTHFFCSTFDALCGICCLLGHIALNGGGTGGNQRADALKGITAYFFSHSYGHYVAGTELIEPGSTTNKESMELKDVIVLAAILSIGPMHCASYLIKAKKISKTVGNTFGILTLIFITCIYAFYIRRPCYALLYINISIILTSALPKVFMVGFQSENDVHIRLSDFTWLKYFTSLFVTMVVFCEPFHCDSFISKWGGHFIFDLSLALDAFTTLIAMPVEDERKRNTKIE